MEEPGKEKINNYTFHTLSTYHENVLYLLIKHYDEFRNKGKHYEQYC